jgi:asparagine synthase (glutamine-hydrolysing)
VAVDTNGLSALEIAAHIILGREAAAHGVLERQPTVGVVAALETVLLKLLLTPPCVIAFSGGRDSSVLLSLAVRLARREGLQEPIPVTLRFPSSTGAQEDEWQERVISHLALRDWVRRSFDDELDLVGPVARDVLRRDGLPYPYNLHLQVPMLEVARGGSLVTGLGGDEAFSPSSRVWNVLMGRVRPRRADAKAIVRSLAPQPFRVLFERRGTPLSLPWLLPDANRLLVAAWSSDQLRLPLRWDARLREWWLSRYVHLAAERIARLAAGFGVSACHPFVEPSVIAALARDIGARGFTSRDGVLERLFGDVLPPGVAQRVTKAGFDDVLWNRHSRAFVDAMRRGRLADALHELGVAKLVDAERLAEEWSHPSPQANSFLLLQGCWLGLRG